jgi:hypothetical protein
VPPGFGAGAGAGAGLGAGAGAGDGAGTGAGAGALPFVGDHSDGVVAGVQLVPAHAVCVTSAT